MAFKTSNKIRFAGCAILLFLLILLPLFYIRGGPHTEAVPQPFSSAEWKDADTWRDTRCAMLSDLRFRIGIEGKSRSELIDLLGQDEDEGSDPNISHWHLCPSFMDVWILEVSWEHDIAADSWVRDT